MVDHWVKVIFIDNIAKVDSRESLDGWLDPGEKGVFTFVKGQNKGDSAVLVLLKNSFGNLQSFEIVWHEHEGKTEEDKPIFKFEIFLDFVKVHIVDLYLLIIVE